MVIKKNATREAAMSRFAIDELEKSWLDEKARSTTPLTPGILGKIAACALFMENNVENRLFTSIAIEDIFLHDLNNAPKDIRNILHLDVGVEKTSVRECTEMMLGVQRAGIAGRFNPEYDRLQMKWDSSNAGELLERYKIKFPDVVAWIRKRAREESVKNCQATEYDR